MLRACVCVFSVSCVLVFVFAVLFPDDPSKLMFYPIFFQSVKLFGRTKRDPPLIFKVDKKLFEKDWLLLFPLLRDLWTETDCCEIL